MTGRQAPCTPSGQMRSRAWKFVGKWFGVVADSRAADARLQALWKLKHYQHDLKVDDSQMEEGRQRFTKWWQKLKAEHYLIRQGAAQPATYAEQQAKVEQEAASLGSLKQH